MGGHFVTIEGIEGAGKSTLRSRLADFAATLGIEAVLTREPGATSLGLTVRNIVLDPKNKKLDPIAELMLFSADRAQHLEEIVRPALKRNALVICDRYIHSTLAYQGYARGLDLGQLRVLNEFITRGLTPNLVILLDLPPETGLKRAQERIRKSSGTFHADQVKEALAAGTGTGWTRFEEQDIEFHTRIRNGFLALAKDPQNRFTVLDATQTPEQVAEAAITALKKLLGR